MKLFNFDFDKFKSDDWNFNNLNFNFDFNFDIKYIVAALGVFLMILGSLGLYAFREGNIIERKDVLIKVDVAPGMRARDIGALLEEKGVIGNSNRFWIMAKLRGDDKRFMAGRYNFHSGMKTEAVLNKLVVGEVTEKKFVIPEGFTVKDIAKRLNEEGIASESVFLEKAKNFRPFDYIEKNDEAYFTAEGFLFPDTYNISVGATEEDILSLMANTFDEKLTEEMRERAKTVNLSIYELITLASLVEKEARFKEDQPIIAQVFFKRLEIGMPLQSDATLQYLMDAPKEDVAISDTKIDSPYNTYQNMGLPPGPVANPGIEAINAVLYPADTDYLYFVADRDGHNHYTYSYSSHLDKVSEVR